MGQYHVRRLRLICALALILLLLSAHGVGAQPAPIGGQAPKSEALSPTATQPVITQQPSSVSACAGQAVSFTANATGTPSPTVQWQASSDGGISWTTIAGATSPVYSFTATLGDTGTLFRAVFTNSAGTARTNPAGLTVITTPQVTTQPTTRSVAVGQVVGFSAGATGNPTVQWQVSTDAGATWTDIAGATLSVYSFTASLADNGKWFHAVFTNRCGSATSNPAAVTVHVGRWPVSNDINGDGKADIVWRNFATGQDVGWLMNGPALGMWGWLPTVTDFNWKIVGIGDLDGDGKADLVWRNSATGQNVVWLMNGLFTPTWVWLPTFADLNSQVVGVGDLDGDGKADIVWRNFATGENIGWLMDGPNIAGYSWLPTVPGVDWKVVGVGDVNGDGKADIVWRNFVTGQDSVWLMNGAYVFVSQWLPTISDLNWKVVGVGDINGDGIDDVVWRNFSTGENNAWLMSTTYVGTTRWFPTVADLNWQIVAVADLDGDGTANLIWRNFVTGKNVAWLITDNQCDPMDWVYLPTVSDLNWRLISPASLTSAQTGVLPNAAMAGMGRSGAEAAKPMELVPATGKAPLGVEPAKDAKPFWSDAPKDAKPLWSAPPKDAKPFWSGAPKDAKPFWSDAPKDAKPMQ